MLVHRRDLELAYRRIAFALHSSVQREKEYDWILAQIGDLFKGRPYAASQVLNELIDPCNILVPMTDDGKYGFGHLRYQEFLCALEISSNRAIRLGPLLSDPWWRGVLVLVAQLIDDMEWIISTTGRMLKITTCEQTLKAMILARPKQEHAALLQVLAQESKHDAASAWLKDIDDYEDEETSDFIG